MCIRDSDYITKPFNILEVKARMKAILRRNAVTEKKAAKSNIISAGDMKIDCDSRNLYIAGRPINLTAKEFDLLELLAVNPGKVYSRDNLLKAVWGQDYSGDGRTVDVHMRRLREKIEDNPSELSLLMHIAPCQTDHVGAAQSRQAGEQERPLDGRIFAFCLSEPLHLFDGQVHACSLFGLETLDAPHGVDRYDAILVCLIQAGPQFIEVADP